MKLTDVELKQALMQQWHECQKTNRLYYKAREEAIKSLEPLLVAWDEANAAYKKLQAEFMKRIKRV